MMYTHLRENPNSNLETISNIIENNLHTRNVSLVIEYQKCKMTASRFHEFHLLRNRKYRACTACRHEHISPFNIYAHREILFFIFLNCARSPRKIKSFAAPECSVSGCWSIGEWSSFIYFCFESNCPSEKQHFLWTTESISFIFLLSNFNEDWCATRQTAIMQSQLLKTSALAGRNCYRAGLFCVKNFNRDIDFVTFVCLLLLLFTINWRSLFLLTINSFFSLYSGTQCIQLGTIQLWWSIG